MNFIDPDISTTGRKYDFKGSQDEYVIFEQMDNVWMVQCTNTVDGNRPYPKRFQDLKVVELEEMASHFRDIILYPSSLLLQMLIGLEYARDIESFAVYGEDHMKVAYKKDTGWVVHFVHLEPKERPVAGQVGRAPSRTTEMISGTMSVGYLRYLEGAFHKEHFPMSLRSQIKEAIVVAEKYQAAMVIVAQAHQKE